MQSSQSGALKKITYVDGDSVRALKGFLIGESPDGLFFVVRRPLGDEIWLAKSAVRTISPARDEGVRP